MMRLEDEEDEVEVEAATGTWMVEAIVMVMTMLIMCSRESKEGSENLLLLQSQSRRRGDKDI